MVKILKISLVKTPQASSSGDLKPYESVDPRSRLKIGIQSSHPSHRLTGMFPKVLLWLPHDPENASQRVSAPI